MPRERHIRRPRRPLIYALLLAAAVAMTAVSAYGLWSLDHEHTIAAAH